MQQSPAHREALANAYERGDGVALGKLSGELLALIPGGGSVGGVSKLAELQDVSKTVKVVQKADKTAVEIAGAGNKVEKGDAALGVCTTPDRCFVAGTQVLTDKGLKAIETFVGGELVWSRSDQTGEYGFQPVVAHKATPYQAIYRVVVKNGSGYRETFRATAEHPFWLKDQGWLKASLLQTDMVLVDHAGQPLVVVSQEREGELDTVFNIQVAEFQTYHVGELGVWVHNADCCDPVGLGSPDISFSTK